jgi:hypothetical protein
MATKSTFSLFFRKFDQDLNDKIFPAQGWGRCGVYPKKPGRGSHHPLMAFVAELNMIANAWIQSGSTKSI